MTAAEIQKNLNQARQELIRTTALLARVVRSLPEPEFEDGSDRPLNPAAELYGLLDGLRRDELALVIRLLGQAHELTRSLP